MSSECGSRRRQEIAMKLKPHSSSDIRLEIVRTAADLFHSRGLWSTTTEEIVEATSIPKAEFHQHFKSKSEVACAALRYYLEELAAGIGPVKYELNSWEDLEECLSSHVEFQKKFKMTRSCPIGTLGNELKEPDDLTRQALTLILDLMLARFESFFSREKVAGRLSSAADVEQLANFCVATIQGAMLTGKIRRNCHAVQTVFEDLLKHLRCYRTAPAATKRRLGGAARTKRLPTLPEPSEPTTLATLDDAPTTRPSIAVHEDDSLPS